MHSQGWKIIEQSFSALPPQVHPSTFEAEGFSPVPSGNQLSLLAYSQQQNVHHPHGQPLSWLAVRKSFLILS